MHANFPFFHFVLFRFVVVAIVVFAVSFETGFHRHVANDLKGVTEEIRCIQAKTTET